MAWCFVVQDPKRFNALAEQNKSGPGAYFGAPGPLSLAPFRGHGVLTIPEGSAAHHLRVGTTGSLHGFNPSSGVPGTRGSP